MSTITFKTTVQDGIIKIPDEYHQDLGSTDIVEVTIVSKRKTARTGMIAALIENPILVDNFKLLTREEAHDRSL